MGGRGILGMRTAAVAAAAASALLAACTSAPGRTDARLSAAGDAPTSSSSTTASTPAPTTAPPPTTTTQPPPPPTTAAPPPRVRAVPEQEWVPFATVAGVVLHHPSRRVERIGFHESNHDGAQQLAALPTAVRPSTLESRERGTGSQTAADIVADPAAHIRAPVTGTVKRAGSYVLYCKDRDYYAVIEPDARPGWEVKVLHMTSMNVRAGQRVIAGRTVIANGPRQLPFESQVDELDPAGAWPHIHIEVVDPTIPDRPTPGGGCR